MFENKSDKNLSSTQSQIKVIESVLKLNQEINDKSKVTSSELTKVPTHTDLIEDNFLFDYKYVNPIKLYYRVSEKLDIFLMIIATIFTIGSGLSNAIKSTLLGDAINNLATTVGTKDLPDEEYELLMDTVEPEVNKTIKKFLIYGSIMLVFNFLSEFL